jgi:hypothetical protein
VQYSPTYDAEAGIGSTNYWRVFSLFGLGPRDTIKAMGFVQQD